MKKAAPVEGGADLICLQLAEKRATIAARDKAVRVKGAVDELQGQKCSLGL